MIRVEITEKLWRSLQSGVVTHHEPIEDKDRDPEVEYVQDRKVLLVQEFDVLRVEPIVALLNRLQTVPLCVCGHPCHHGRCDVIEDGGAMYASSSNRCDCRRYQTEAEADLRKVTDKLVESECTLASTETKLEAAEAEIENLTRKHENLLVRRKKKGAKRR